MKDTNLFAEFEPIATKDWLAKIEKDLKGKPLESLDWEIDEGIIVKPFYRREDILEHGEPHTCKTDNNWLIQEEVEVGDGVTAAKKANKKVLDILMQGVESVNFTLDNVTSGKDFATMLKGIHPEMITLYFGGLFTESEPGTVLSHLLKWLKDEKINSRNIKGGVLVDPVGFFVETGEYYETYDTDMMELEGALLLANDKLPQFSVINIDTTSFHNQGSQAAQELALALSIGSEYLTRLTEFELAPEVVAQHMQFTFCTAGSYFIEIAKIRAFRLLWKNVLTAFEVKNSLPVQVHAKTSLRTQTEDEHTNMIRSTTEAMSAILGGADLLTVQPADSVYGEPTDFTRRVARNLQHILKQESYLNQVADPAAGSYYIETLSRKLAKKAWEKFQKIEQAGGILEFMGV